MDYETTLAVVRDLSEHRLTRDPRARVISRVGVRRAPAPAARIVRLSQERQREELEELRDREAAGFGRPKAWDVIRGGV